jgi:hypothetical protein
MEFGQFHFGRDDLVKMKFFLASPVKGIGKREGQTLAVKLEVTREFQN